VNPIGWLVRLFRREEVDPTENVTPPEEKRRQEDNLREWQHKADALRVRARLQRDGG